MVYWPLGGLVDAMTQYQTAAGTLTPALVHFCMITLSDWPRGFSYEPMVLVSDKLINTIVLTSLIVLIMPFLHAAVVLRCDQICFAQFIAVCSSPKTQSSAEKLRSSSSSNS